NALPPARTPQTYNTENQGPLDRKTRTGTSVSLDCVFWLDWDLERVAVGCSRSRETSATPDRYTQPPTALIRRHLPAAESASALIPSGNRPMHQPDRSDTITRQRAIALVGQQFPFD